MTRKYTELPSFDELIEIHQANPDELDEVRRQLSNQLIEGSSERYRRRMHGLMFQIEMTLRKGKNPIHRSVLLSQMLHKYTHQLHSAIDDLTSLKLSAGRH